MEVPDVYGLHFISGCNKTGGRIGLHNIVRNVVAKELGDLGIGMVDLEPPDLIREVMPNSGERPDICLRVVSTAASGKPYKVLDVAVVNPFPGTKNGNWGSMTRREALTSQKLAKRRVAQKDSVYKIFHENADLASKIEFSGIVFETTGGVEASAERFFRERARESAAVTGRQVGSIFQNMMRKISAGLQKGSS